MLLTRVKATTKKHRMLGPGDKVVVAVSGGPDSVCLLSVLRAFAEDLDLSLHVAHLDHMFRGEESATEARFVEDMAKKLNIPSTVQRIDVPAFCAERGLSAQAGAREARYRFLSAVAENIGARRIALGHTADDQAETLLMRLIRGAGAAGLSSIPPVREKVIRPLIETTRTEILAYLKGTGLEFVTDPSNVKPLYTRNRVRREIMPVLERFNPAIIETLATEAALLRDEDEAMAACLADITSRILTRENDVVRIKREGFNGLLPALKRRVLRAAVSLMAGADPSDLSAVRTEEALGFMADAQTGRVMKLPYGLTLEREYDALIVRPEEHAAEFNVRLLVPGVTAIWGRSLEVEMEVLETKDRRGTRDERGENYLWQAVFDYDKIALPLYLRSRRSGDWFQPAGMGGGSKKLQDYFVDEKVPRLKRSSVPLLSTEHDIVWVAGMRTDGRFLPGEETKRLLTVTVRGKNDLR